MRDDEAKAVALVVIVLMGLVSVYPILEGRMVVEPFSELAVLGPNKRLGDYPHQVAAGQKINLYLYVGNHEGAVEYFRILAKLGDRSSNVSDISPLDAPLLLSWDLILPNDGNATQPITLSVPNPGLDQRLVFELHIYDSELGSFIYNKRWTQLWLNVTVTG